MAEGFLPRDAVLKVLGANGVIIEQRAGGETVLAKGSVITVQVLPELLRRRLIAHLAGKFGIDTYRFYRQEDRPTLSVVKKGTKA